MSEYIAYALCGLALIGGAAVIGAVVVFRFHHGMWPWQG